MKHFDEFEGTRSSCSEPLFARFAVVFSKRTKIKKKHEVQSLSASDIIADCAKAANRSSDTPQKRVNKMITADASGSSQVANESAEWVNLTYSRTIFILQTCVEALEVRLGGVEMSFRTLWSSKNVDVLSSGGFFTMFAFNLNTFLHC